MAQGKQVPSEATAGQFRDELVIDTDVHISYTDDIQRKVSDRMEPPWNHYVDPERVPAHERRPLLNLPKSLGGVKDFLETAVVSPDVLKNRLHKPMGIDYSIINFLGRLDSVFKTERAIEEMRGMNTFLLDEFLDDNNDVFATIPIAMRAPDKAAEEIDRIGSEDQIVGVFMFVGTEFQHPPGDPRYDVLYEAMADNALTPFFHISGFLSKAASLREYETCFAWHSTGPAWSAMWTIASLIAQGTPEKFPELDFVIAEGGLSYVPFMMARLNREYNQWSSEAPLLEQSPESYLRERFYFTTQPLGEFNDPRMMKQIFDIVGLDSVMFSTDYPHYDFDTPHALEAVLSGYAPADREKVLSGNAIEAFNLPL